MTATVMKRKYGMVVILDALGASCYTDDQIKKFLSARTKINFWIRGLTSRFPGKGNIKQPSIFTFADTIILTIQLSSQKNMLDHIWLSTFLMRRYLFHSIEEGILFRGAFSIGHYIEDISSNTVMGPAVTDAAAWYNQPEWVGLSSTPLTNSALEYYYCDTREKIGDRGYLCKYDVPMKGGNSYNLYTVDWPSAFFDKQLLQEAKKGHPRKYFLEIMKNMRIPKGTENKYDNTKEFFTFIEKIINDKKKLSKTTDSAH